MPDNRLKRFRMRRHIGLILHRNDKHDISMGFCITTITTNNAENVDTATLGFIDSSDDIRADV